MWSSGVHERGPCPAGHFDVRVCPKPADFYNLRAGIRRWVTVACCTRTTPITAHISLSALRRQSPTARGWQWAKYRPSSRGERGLRCTATPVANGVTWRHSAARGEFEAPFLNGRSRSVNRKVRSSNLRPRAKFQFRQRKYCFTTSALQQRFSQPYNNWDRRTGRDHGSLRSEIESSWSISPLTPLTACDILLHQYVASPLPHGGTITSRRADP